VHWRSGPHRPVIVRPADPIQILPAQEARFFVMRRIGEVDRLTLQPGFPYGSPRNPELHAAQQAC
jgi:hypothetical protein